MAPAALDRPRGVWQVKLRLGRWLCRHGIHSWEFMAPNYTGDGAYERCRRCRCVAELMFCGARIVFEEPKE
jgi:hypothetical protein